MERIKKRLLDIVRCKRLDDQNNINNKSLSEEENNNIANLNNK